jgi:hypothetical protein
VKIAVGEEKFVEIHVGVLCAVLLLITLGNCKHLAFAGLNQKEERRKKFETKKTKRRECV